MENQKPRIVELDIDTIEIVPDANPRLDFEGLFDLEDSLSTTGQVYDIIVERRDNKNILLDGECRVRSAKEKGIKFLSAKVFENIDVLTRLRLSSVGDKHRPLKPLEKARDMQRYVDELGWTAKDLAKEFNITKENAERLLKLLTLPSDIQKMMQRQNNPLPAHQAGMLLKLPESKQREAAREIAPSLGPVMNETQAKLLLDEKYGDPKLDIDKPQTNPVDPAKQTPAEPEEKVETTRSLGDLKPVAAKIGIAGKLFATSAGGIEILKATFTVNIDGDVKVLSFDKINVPANAEVLKLIKKHQKKKETAKKTSKSKADKSEKTEAETETPESEE